MPAKRCGSVSAPQACGEIALIDREDFGAAGIESRERAQEMKRRAALGARLGKGERAVLELEDRERDASRRPFLRLEPAQPPGYPEMQHEIQRSFELEHDALADAPDAGHALALGLADRRHRRAA